MLRQAHNLYLARRYTLGWMVTGFDILGHDRRLRKHWRFRIIAFLIDALLTIIPTVVLLWLLDVTDIAEIGLISNLAFFHSSFAVESFAGGTAGKLLLGFRVHSVSGKHRTVKVILRNMPRLLWFFILPIDLACGLATKGDPRQRLLDRALGVKVVHRSEARWSEVSQDMPGPAQDIPEEEQPTVTEVGEDLCHACGGKLLMLDDQKFQCEECGLMQ